MKGYKAGWICNRHGLVFLECDVVVPSGWVSPVYWCPLCRFPLSASDDPKKDRTLIVEHLATHSPKKITLAAVGQLVEQIIRRERDMARSRTMETLGSPAPV
jgi:hypothetical protein